MLCPYRMSKPIIAVVGVTGQQGGSVAKALAKNGKYAIRGITRNPDADKAKAIAVSSRSDVLEMKDIHEMKRGHLHASKFFSKMSGSH
jgi:predicted dinucleotide-binding enzyme